MNEPHVNEVRLTAAGWAALRHYVTGTRQYASKGGVTNCVNHGVLERTEEGVEVTPLGEQVAQSVWGLR